MITHIKSWNLTHSAIEETTIYSSNLQKLFYNIFLETSAQYTHKDLFAVMSVKHILKKESDFFLTE